MENLSTFKNEIVKIGKRLYDKGFVPGASGNISIKYKNNILITPSGMNLADVTEEDVSVLDIDGNNISEKKPSSEKKMHLEIYKARPDITSIVHAHAPKATAFAVAGIPLNAPILSEALVILGYIPVAEYAMPSSDKLALIVADYFKTYDAVLMANHGVVLGGTQLKDVYYKLETLELYAEISIGAKLLGNLNELSKENIQELMELRKSLLKQ
ncbi:MAG: hypothetical protein ACD_20C00098G0005 [uncultured bacterium]|nr:MAG: hypothetical protein ACD_20C00098G0005 [uncultured bacterium]HBH18925.1 class II aldolase family protein [Cyanobacteria bacterium UBA9579]